MASTSALPPIDMGTPMARELQSRIQRALASKAWAEEGDEVMAEYVLVMLANNKTASQINAELSDLIGSEYSDDFTQWLWAERANLADEGVAEPSEPKVHEVSAAAAAAAEPSQVRRSRSPVQEQQRRRSYDRRSASPGAGGASRDGLASRWQRSPQQEQRGGLARPHELPPQNERWGRIDSARQQRNGWGAQREQNRRELFGEPSRRPDDRMGGPSRPHQGMASDDPSLDAPQDARAPPTAPRALRVKGVAQSSLFQRSLGQAQSQTSQQQQQQQQQQGALPSRPSAGASPSLFSRMSVPDPRAAPFQPLGVQGAPAQPSQPSAPATGFASISSLLSRIDPMVPDNPLPSDGPSGASAAPAVDPSTFPKKPAHTSLCRYGTRCSDPTCQYSHPSVAAVSKARQTGEEPLILNSQACNFQETCTRPDCERGHISPSVAFIKAKLEREGGLGSAAAVPAVGSSETAACKFQDKCTNPSCIFAHFDGAGNVGPSPALSKMATHPGEQGYSLLPQTEHDGMDADDDVDFTMNSEETAGGGGGASSSSNDAASLKARLDARLDRPLGSGLGSAPSSIPCRFGAACFREDCHFQHPLGRKAGSTTSGARLETRKTLGPCRYGLGCNRPDCHFSHPSGHALSSNTGSTAADVGSKASSHISDRLARFGEAGDKENGDSDMERIIPGSGLEGGAATDDDDVSFRRRMKQEGDVVDLEGPPEA